MAKLLQAVKGIKGFIKLNINDRFWSKVEKSDGCWNWVGSKSCGYGSLSINGRAIKAHRWSFTQAFGAIPDGLFVCHKCDNPACVRPDHLFLGTNKDNLIDCAKKGRNAMQKHPERSALHDPNIRAKLDKGEGNYAAKLTEGQVAEIRKRYKRESYMGSNARNLAEEFGVNKATIQRIVKGDIWTHI